MYTLSTFSLYNDDLSKVRFTQDCSIRNVIYMSNPLPLNFLDNYNTHGAAIDLPHAILIYGALVSAKPDRVLEIGIGTAFITRALLDGVAYNGKGSITCVDSFYDLGTNLSQENVDSLKEKVTLIAPKTEHDFVHETSANSYDFLVSDGDHDHAGEWADKVFEIMAPNSFCFFHDVNHPHYTNLQAYHVRAKEFGKPHFLFTQNSREDERCDRGLLMIVNTK